MIFYLFINEASGHLQADEPVACCGSSRRLSLVFKTVVIKRQHVGPHVISHPRHDFLDIHL